MSKSEAKRLAALGAPASAGSPPSPAEPESPTSTRIVFIDSGFDPRVQQSVRELRDGDGLSFQQTPDGMRILSSRATVLIPWSNIRYVVYT